MYNMYNINVNIVHKIAILSNMVSNIVCNYALLFVYNIEKYIVQYYT